MSSKINVIRSYMETSPRFGLTRNSMHFKFKPLPLASCDFEQFLHEACEEILLAITSDLQENWKVGFTFEIENKRSGWLPFRLASQITSDQVWGILDTILQSNEHTIINEDKFTIVATAICPPQGQGRGRRYNTHDEESIMRKGIIRIKNKDSLCLPRALVIAIAKVTKDKEYDLIRKNRGQRQTKQAWKLVEDAEINIPVEGCGIPELQKFQEYLHDYSIVVYAAGEKGRDVIFKSNNPSKKKLNLLLNDNHYDVITSLTAAFCCRYYCENCNVPYNNKGRHYCDKRCPCCMNYLACPNTDNMVRCEDCKRRFRGSECFAKHKTTEVCKKLRKCHVCLKNFTTDDHICGSKFCKICKSVVPQDHYCYMQINTTTPKQKGVLFVFFDLETVIGGEYYKGGNLFEPNLCVLHKKCNECISNDTAAKKQCNLCDVKIITDFDGGIKTNVIENFMNDILQTRKNEKVSKLIAVAHNGQSFDHQFILNHILTKTSLKPKIIMRGSKIIRMELDNVIFLDSLNYFPMGLKDLPKAFDLPPSLKKGYFPHLFNSPANQNYHGELPDMKFYDPDSMRSPERRLFIEWYEENKTKPFNFQEELIEYCKSDVTILMQACLKFRSMFLDECGVCPFTEACTIASACNKVFRKNFLKPNTIGIIPKNGYRLCDRQSAVAIEWLVYEESSRNIDIEHSAKGREVILNGMKVDGYAPSTNQVFEFYGCYYHGCPDCFADNDDMLLKYQATRSKSDRLRSFNYTVIEMWECTFNRKRAEVLKTIENHPLLSKTPLNPRDAFYGGRTGNVKEHYRCKDDEKIKYLDVCSLYPWVCKVGKFPIGHPKVKVGDQPLPANGLVKCKILPPQDLYHPVLPIRLNNKLMFVLCMACAKSTSDDECYHTEEERALSGTWVVDEIQKAVEKGYKVIEVYESWIYEVVQLSKDVEGLFTKMMDKFIKIKQEASGWPRENMTQQEKEDYVSEFLDSEGIQLEFEKIVKNPGLRSLAKLMLNSFWGKLGQRDNLSKTEIIHSAVDLYRLAYSTPDALINNVIPINNHTVIVNWEKHEEAVEEQSTVNVCVAAYVTAQARLKLYSYLEQLGERVLYYDTDSVIFISKLGLPEPKTGNNIGDLTDELLEYGEGSFITEFVSGGPKHYAYELIKPNGEKHHICKVKGFKLDYRTSEQINFDSMKKMVLDKDLLPIPILSKNFRRTEAHEVIVKEEIKRYKVNSAKRKFDENFESVPFGFKGKPRKH